MALVAPFVFITTKTYPSGPLKFFAKVFPAGVSQKEKQREGESLHLRLTYWTATSIVLNVGKIIKLV